MKGYRFYLEVPDEHCPKIERVAARLPKADEHQLIGAHIAHAMRMPELALVIRADSDQDAFTIVQDIWEQVCRRAGLEVRPPSIALALQPKAKR